MASKKQVAQAVTILANAYPNSRLVAGSDDVPGTLDIYAEMLSDLDGEVLLSAVKYCLKTYPAYMPSIATILEAAEKIRATKAGDDMSGQEAWGWVLAEIKCSGLYHEPSFHDERIKKAVACIGWRIICMSDEQDPSIRYQFIKVFETFAARAKTQSIIAQIEAPSAYSLMGKVTAKLTGR